MRTMSGVVAAIALTCVAGSAQAQDWDLEIYGGTIPDRRETWGGFNDFIDRGKAFGFGGYNNALLPGFSLGLDVMSTRSQYTEYPGEYVDSLSLIGVVRKDFQITPSLEGFVGGGIGLIRNTYDDRGTDYADTVPGAQLSLGLRHELVGKTKVYGEIKHQVGLEDAFYDDLGVEQSYQSTSALVGLQFGF